MIRTPLTITLTWLIFLTLAPGCDDSTSNPTDAGGDAMISEAGGDGPAGMSHGILGRFSALAAFNGTLMASAYESTYGDLVFISAATSDVTKLTKEIVDGVPNLPPTKPTTSWRGGIVEHGDDVGADTDIAVTSAGVPMISYHDRDNLGLKFAIKTVEKWSAHSVEKASGGKEVVGRYTSMAMVNGKPAVAYLALNLSGATAGTYRSELRWAVASSAAPSSSTDWTITTIDAGTMSCQGLCAKDEACLLKSDACAKKTTTCTATCASGEECVGGTCQAVRAGGNITDIPMAIGLWPSVVIAAGAPVVIYHDRLNGNLKGATLVGGKWKPSVIKGTSTDDVGAYCSAAASAAGEIHVAYQDAVKGSLNYVSVDATSLAAKVSEVIDDGVRSDGVHLVGADPAIIVTSAGKILVIYQDAHTADLLLAERSGTNSWTPNTSTDPDLGRKLKGGTKGYGFYSDMANDGATTYGSSFFYDQTAKPKGSLELFKVK